ncbi:MAG: hypothetical protein GY847_28425 [Proteobacteria bacterium]|nr:hypothetical protein [Pseudomonadota bacterium]
MKSKVALKVFNKHLENQKISLAKSDPLVCIDAMLSFYKEMRFADVNMDEDGDTLLFQYGGPYSWEPGFFDLNITRQFIRKKNGEMKQLSLSFLYPVTENALEDNRWCTCVEEIDGFRKYIMDSEAVSWIRDKKYDKYDLQYEKV